VGPFSKRFSFFKKTIGQNVFLMGRVNSQRKLHVRRFRCVWVLPHHVWVLHIQSFFCKWSQIILDILDRAGLLFFVDIQHISRGYLIQIVNKFNIIIQYHIILYLWWKPMPDMVRLKIWPCLAIAWLKLLAGI
jgi:hypothetical protein